MSQASPSHVGAAERHRRAVARFIAGCVEGHRTKDGHARAFRVDQLLDGSIFDVHAVRTAAEAMLREAIEVEQVFADWTRSLGLGPENREPSAFVGPAREVAFTVGGQGTAGAFAIEVAGVRTVYSTSGPASAEEVAHSLAVALGEQHPDQGATSDGSSVTFGRTRIGGWPGNLARHPNNPCPSWAPMAKSRARLARRVLAAIDGQSSDCQGCTGKPGGVGRRPPTFSDLPTRDTGRVQVKLPKCPDCHGTGHNLRGTLHALVLPTVLVRWAEDASCQARTGDTYGPRLAPIQERILTDAEDACWLLAPDQQTRVVPRGKHRDLQPDRWGRHAEEYCPASTRRARMELATKRALANWHPTSEFAEWSIPAHEVGAPWALLPRWRRGELRHAEKRSRVALTFRGQLMGYADGGHDDMVDALPSGSAFDTGPGVDFGSVLDRASLRPGDEVGGARVESVEITGTTDDGIVTAQVGLSLPPIRELRVTEEFAIPADEPDE